MKVVKICFILKSNAVPNLIAQSSEEPTKQFLNPKLQEELNRFKEIQRNPQLLLQTLLEMEREKQLPVSSFHCGALDS